jgi:hypothetical protein
VGSEARIVGGMGWRLGMLGSGVRSHISDLSDGCGGSGHSGQIVVRSRDAPAARLIHSHFRASRPLLGLVSLLVCRQFSEMLVFYLGVRRGLSPVASSPGIDHRADPLLVFSIEESRDSSIVAPSPVLRPPVEVHTLATRSTPAAARPARPARASREGGEQYTNAANREIVDVATAHERRLSA